MAEDGKVGQQPLGGVGNAQSPRGSRDARSELENLEQAISELRTEYEQFFIGILPLPPDKLHAEVKRRIRLLRKYPFKNSRIKFKLHSLERRFQTYNTYWQRVLREKEAGTYYKDVFRADLKAKFAQEDKEAGSAKSGADRYVQGLFHSYVEALEKACGKKQQIDYGKFREELVKRAKSLKEQAQGKKVTFRVVNKGGRVTLEARFVEKRQG